MRKLVSRTARPGLNTARVIDDCLLPQTADAVATTRRPQVLEMQNGQVRLFHRAQLPGAPGAASAAATAAASPRGAAAAAAEACEPWCSDGSWVGPELMAVAPLATVVGAC